MIKQILSIFFCFDVYNYILRDDELYPLIATPLVALFAIIIQGGIFACPIVAILISDNLSIGYKIMIGGGIGSVLTGLKEIFTNAERKRELKAMQDKLNIHDAKHNEHDAKFVSNEEKLNEHDAKLNEHDTKLVINEEKLNEHDAKFAINEEKLNGHDAKFEDIEHDMKWVRPITWPPFDHPSNGD